ncbi:hypothetical protein HX099_11470 [Thiopseudomonas alkaliphila]|uniref:VWA domain-containing protein n=1 Tax=Thiopseudomonas alkaliphila TaxID=1697053 RepID=A0AAW7DV85_9GAMM|nr:hypothetical protein [Thiopseudomonas alkaliphila]MDM1697270.1 hypothetical protein [Thiopseudomonas alkaliphila]
MSLSKLHCVIDCSGSMAEYGKPMLLVNLLRYIRQFTTQNGQSARYFSWQEAIAEINWPAEADVELPTLVGSSDVAALCNWAEESSEVVLLVLTDGYFKLGAEQLHQLSQLDNLYLLGVGGDADLVQLNILSNRSYRAEQLDHVLHIVFRSEAAAVGPSRRVELAGVVAESALDDEW